MKIIFYNRVPKKLKANFDQLMRQSFTWSTAGKKKAEEYDKFCSQKDQIGYVLSLDDSQIIGAVIILKRRIKFNDADLVLGGIGGVSVRQKYRRQGMATVILKTAMKKLKQEKCDVAYLCTDINKLKNLYAKVGFVPLNRSHTFLGRSGKKYTEHDAMIASVNSIKKFKDVMLGNKSFNIGVGNW